MNSRHSRLLPFSWKWNATLLILQFCCAVSVNDVFFYVGKKSSGDDCEALLSEYLKSGYRSFLTELNHDWKGQSHDIWKVLFMTLSKCQQIIFETERKRYPHILYALYVQYLLKVSGITIHYVNVSVISYFPSTLNIEDACIIMFGILSFASFKALFRANPNCKVKKD
jgi:hypothetical protein